MSLQSQFTKVKRWFQSVSNNLWTVSVILSGKHYLFIHDLENEGRYDVSWDFGKDGEKVYTYMTRMEELHEHFTQELEENRKIEELLK